MKRLILSTGIAAIATMVLSGCAASSENSFKWEPVNVYESVNSEVKLQMSNSFIAALNERKGFSSDNVRSGMFHGGSFILREGLHFKKINQNIFNVYSEVSFLDRDRDNRESLLTKNSGNLLSSESSTFVMHSVPCEKGVKNEKIFDNVENINGEKKGKVQRISLCENEDKTYTVSSSLTYYYNY